MNTKDANRQIVEFQAKILDSDSSKAIEHDRLALSPQLVTCAIPGLVYYIGRGVEQFSSV
jgi:hypothetical protein